MPAEPKIFPLAPGSITVDFGNEISVSLNDKAISLATWFDQNPFPGFIEAAPAYSSVAIFYDLTTVRRNFTEFRTSFDAVHNIVRSALENLSGVAPTDGRMIEIAVDFGASSALDLDDVANESGLSRIEVIEVFLSKTYRVFMLGFLPGFPYMGEVDERIAVPRKRSPRTRVPKGSVGIAGRQTGIYPLESPGGWQIIGVTDLELFAPDADPPTLLRPGDEIRFVDGAVG
jgi:inhibitor of KinA